MGAQMVRGVVEMYAVAAEAQGKGKLRGGIRRREERRQGAGAVPIVGFCLICSCFSEFESRDTHERGTARKTYTILTTIQ